MKARVRKTFKEGPVSFMLIETDEEPRVGFRFWRWQPRRVTPGGSTETFKPIHVESLSRGCERLAQELATFGSIDESEPTSREWTLHPRQDTKLLHEQTFGEVLLTIHDGVKGPWFMLRRLVTTEPPTTANWFFEENLPQLENALIEVRRWLDAVDRAA